MLSARLILVRHGQSTYNAQLRLQGQADPPLSEAGREEARALAGALPPFAQVVTSDLVRASETAALLGYPDATRDPRWREIDIGEWQGRSLADFPDETERSLARRSAHPARAASPGCEFVAGSAGRSTSWSRPAGPGSWSATAASSGPRCRTSPAPTRRRSRAPRTRASR